MRTLGLLVACLGLAAAARSVAAADLYAITSGSTAYVAPRSDGSVSRSGIGGIDFTIQSTGGTGTLRGAAFLGTQFVAVGDGGRIVRSSDAGLGWNADTTPVTAALHGATPHGTYLIAVGDAGTTLRVTGTSTVWDSTVSPGGTALYGVTSNQLVPGILVAVGDDGTVLRSTDQGLTWARQLLAGAPDLRAVTVGANSNEFIAVGLAGRIHRSTDFGLTWPQLGSPVGEDLHAVAFDGANRFVAAGESGTVLRSIGGTDGSWFLQAFPITSTLRGAHHDGNWFYVVGDDDVIARSQDGTAWIQTPVQPTSWSDVKTRFR